MSLDSTASSSSTSDRPVDGLVRTASPPSSIDESPLKRYSTSMKNFTYHLFENFRKEVEARDAAPEGKTAATTGGESARSLRRKQRAQAAGIA